MLVLTLKKAQMWNCKDSIILVLIPVLKQILRGSNIFELQALWIFPKNLSIDTVFDILKGVMNGMTGIRFTVACSCLIFGENLLGYNVIRES